MPMNADVELKAQCQNATDSSAKSGAVCPLMHGVSPTGALRAWKLRGLRTNSAAMPTAITTTTIDARFMVELPLITGGVIR